MYPITTICDPRTTRVFLEPLGFLEQPAEPTLSRQEGRVRFHVSIQVGHPIGHCLAIIRPIRFKLERDIVGLQNELEVRIGVELVLSEFLQMGHQEGRVGGRRQMVLEGLDDSVPDPCLWNSKGVLGRLNGRGVGDGEFGG